MHTGELYLMFIGYVCLLFGCFAYLTYRNR